MQVLLTSLTASENPAIIKRDNNTTVLGQNHSNLGHRAFYYYGQYNPAAKYSVLRTLQGCEGIVLRVLLFSFCSVALKKYD